MNDNFRVGGCVWGVDWIHLVRGRGWYVKNPAGVIGSGNMHFLLLFEPFRGVKDKGSEIRWGEGRKE